MRSLFFYIALLFTCLANPSQASAQADEIQWISFEALEDSLALRPKKVFIDFYTDWCTYCRKMDKSVFSKPAVIETLNENFYAVCFNAETDEEIIFGGQLFVNDQVGESRTPLHQIAQLLATRDGEFAPPVLLLLDPEFNALGRNFGYLDSNELLEFLSTK